MTKLLTVAFFTASLLAQGLNVNGNWTGVLSPGPVTLHFNVHLEAEGGTWDSVDQHAVIPVKSVTVTGNAVKSISGLHGSKELFRNPVKKSKEVSSRTEWRCQSF